MMKKLLTLLLAVAMLLSMTAALAEQEPVTISFYSTQAGVDNETVALLGKFMEEHPWITVNYYPCGDDQLAAWLGLYSAGTAPTVSMLDVGQILNYSDYMVNLNTGDTAWMENVLTGWGYCQKEGSDAIYGIPSSVQGFSLMYNKRLVAEVCGADFDVKSVNTVDKLVAFFDKFEAAGIPPTVVFSADWALGSHYLGCQLFSEWLGDKDAQRAIGNNFTFVAFKNYEKLFRNAKFFQSLSRTAWYTVGTVILSNILGLALGLLLTSNLKGRNFFRTAIFVPNVIGGVAMGYIWKYIFHYGFTAVGKNLGIEWLSKSMLSSPGTAMAALIVVSSWQLSAYLMIIYVAGFTNVPGELVEAAKVDGASAWRTFWNVRLPMIRSSITICLFLAIVRSFMVFEVNMSLTDGGPYNSTEMIAYRIYNTAFVSLKFGDAQAQAVVLFIIVAAVSVLQAYFTSRKEVEL